MEWHSHIIAIAGDREQLRRVDKIGQTHLFQRRADTCIDLVPGTTHKTAVCDGAGILRPVDTIIHGNWALNTLDDPNQRDILRLECQPISAIRPPLGVNKTSPQQQLGNLGNRWLVDSVSSASDAVATTSPCR